MQLPSDLQHFPTGALIVASDTVKASFFLVGNDSLAELDGVEVPKETGQDGEGSMEFFPDDAERFHSFIHAVIEQLDALVANHPIAHIHLVMPAEVEHQLSSHLSEDVHAKIGVTIHANLMKEPPLEAVRRVVEHLGRAA